MKNKFTGLFSDADGESDGFFGKMKDKVKTSGAKGKIERNQKEYLREFAKHTRNLENVISFQNSLVAAKQLIINKLNLETKMN